MLKLRMKTQWALFFTKKGKGKDDIKANIGRGVGGCRIRTCAVRLLTASFELGVPRAPSSSPSSVCFEQVIQVSIFPFLNSFPLCFSSSFPLLPTNTKKNFINKFKTLQEPKKINKYQMNNFFPCKNLSNEGIFCCSVNEENRTGFLSLSDIGKREKRARDQRSYQRGSKNESIIESEIRPKWSRMCVL